MKGAILFAGLACWSTASEAQLISADGTGPATAGQLAAVQSAALAAQSTAQTALTNGQAVVTRWEQVNPSTNTITEWDGTTRTYTAGAAAAMAANVSVATIISASAQASLNILLPPNPLNGQIVTVASQVAITAVTIKDATGTTTVFSAALTPLGVGVRFQYEATAWVRIS